MEKNIDVSLRPRVLAVMAAAALLWRFGLALALNDYQYFATLAAQYMRSAQHLAAGRGFMLDAGRDEVASRQQREGRMLELREYPPLEDTAKPVLGYLPGYPAWLSLWFRLGASSLLALRMAQAAVDVLACLLLAALGARMFGERAALWMGWFYALWPPLAVSSVMLLADALTVPLTVFLACALWKSSAEEPRKRWIWWLAVALMVVMHVYLRPNALLMPLFLAACLWVAAPRGMRWKRGLAMLAFSSAVLVLCLLPWAFRNQRLTGHMLWTSTSAGVNLWAALGERPNRWGAEVSDVKNAAMLEENGYQWHSPEADTFLKKKFKQAVREDPLFYASTCAIRAARVVFARQFWGLAPEVTEQGWSEMVRWQGAVGGTLHFAKTHPRPFAQRLLNILLQALDFALLLTALGGAWALWRARRLSQLAVSLFPLAYYFAVSPMVHVEPRYILPVYVSYALLAIPFAAGVWDGRRARKRSAPVHAVVP